MSTYRDLDFNFIAHPVTGDVSLKHDVAAVMQSVRNLVMTNYYERGFNNAIGSTIRHHLFDNFTPLTRSQVKQEIERLIEYYEPRADISDVVVTTDQNHLYVKILFNVLNDPKYQEVYIKLKRIG
jgi:phage baseplate assembly protein W